MTIAKSLASELTHEADSTRKLLERVPPEHFDFKPHPKSMSMRQLASHIVDSFSWIRPMIEEDVFAMNPEEYEPWVAVDKDDLLTTFDKNVESAAELIGKQSDEHMNGDWRMEVGGQVVWKSTRLIVVRTFALGHHIHHRGQLDVYLRLKSVPLPQIYGPTADEPDMRLA